MAACTLLFEGQPEVTSAVQYNCMDFDVYTQIYTGGEY